MPPGVSVFVSAVFFTSTCGTGGRITVVVHGGGVLLGVHNPPGGSTVAVFVTEAGGVAATIAVTVYVTKLPAGKVAIVSLIAPVPDAVQVAPPLGVQVQVALTMPAGIGSLTGVLFAATEPVFVTVTV